MKMPKKALLSIERAKAGNVVLSLWRKMPPLKIRPNKQGVMPPIMDSMRGDPKSNILLITPGCTPEDYANKVPFSNSEALVLHELMLEIKLDTEKCCVISCSRYGLKPNKASTQDVKDAIDKMLALNQFDLIITVGDDAFKFIFGRGKKPAPSIFGHVMYLAETKHKPVFALPELLGINPRIPDDPRTRNKMLDWKDKTEQRFRAILQSLKPLVAKVR